MKRCIQCNKEGVMNIFSVYNHDLFKTIEGETYSKNCAAIHHQDSIYDYQKSQIEQIKITTTNSFEGHQIVRYIDIDSVEIVSGMIVFIEPNDSV